MGLKINTELKDGAVCEMSKTAFNVFLSLDKVVKFKRSDRWVSVEDVSLRGSGENSNYFLEADRRSFI